MSGQTDPLALLEAYTESVLALMQLMDAPTKDADMLTRTTHEVHYLRDQVLRRLAQSAPATPEVLYAERAEYRDGDVTLVGRVFEEGVRIGCQALEPWYGTGVLIPPTHRAYMPAQRLLAALAPEASQ